ncbi:hypothetical protein M3Y99_01301900 [Aphelenchoides fujianensis]|nr:hypothetical protein M3Y99_01301900 [Aphelenchoides fujianensis]
MLKKGHSVDFDNFTVDWFHQKLFVLPDHVLHIVSGTDEKRFCEHQSLVQTVDDRRFWTSIGFTRTGNVSEFRVQELAPLDDLQRLFHVLLPFFGHSPVVFAADLNDACVDGGQKRLFAAKRAFWSEKPPDLPPVLADLWPLIAQMRVHAHRLFLTRVEGEEPLVAFPKFVC